MKKMLKYAISSLSGAACAALPVGLSRLLIRNLSDIFSHVGELAALDTKTLGYASQILSQLRSAVIISPWPVFLLCGAVLGALAARLFMRRPVRGIVISLILMIILLIPLTALALWLTSVNSIYIGSLIQTLLPLLPHLL